jgi:hypothetical protein
MKPHKQKAHKAYNVIKEHSPHLLGTLPNLFQKCVDGVANIERLRARVVPTEHIGQYGTLAGQKFAAFKLTASIDNVLAALIHETKDHKWSWDIVMDPPMIFGSPASSPLDTRAAAEEAVVELLGNFGQPAKPMTVTTQSITPTTTARSGSTTAHMSCRWFPTRLCGR